jgi:hypothetical protein
MNLGATTWASWTTSPCPPGQTVIGQTNSIPPSYICGDDPGAQHPTMILPTADPSPPAPVTPTPTPSPLPAVVAHPLALVSSVVPASLATPGWLGLPLWAWGALAVALVVGMRR